TKSMASASCWNQKRRPSDNVYKTWTWKNVIPEELRARYVHGLEAGATGALARTIRRTSATTMPRAVRARGVRLLFLNRDRRISRPPEYRITLYISLYPAFWGRLRLRSPAVPGMQHRAGLRPSEASIDPPSNGGYNEL